MSCASLDDIRTMIKKKEIKHKCWICNREQGKDEIGLESNDLGNGRLLTGEKAQKIKTPMNLVSIISRKGRHDPRLAGNIHAKMRRYQRISSFFFKSPSIYIFCILCLVLFCYL